MDEVDEVEVAYQMVKSYLVSDPLFRNCPDADPKTKVAHLYRNGKQDWFDKCFKEGRYEEVGYMQAANYQGNERLDRKVNGLYFCATRTGFYDRTKKFPATSPYGRKRVIVPIEEVIRKDDSLFFVNAYRINDNMYVVLAVFSTDEIAEQIDEISASGIKQLDKGNNDIFQVNEESGEWEYTGGIWLEIFRAGDVQTLAATKGNDCTDTGRNTLTAKK